MNLRTKVADLLIALAVTATAANAADPVCPSDNYTDYFVKSEAKVSASLLTRVLSSLGLTGQYEKDSKARLPTQDDKIMAILTFGTICRMVMQDVTLTTMERTTILQKWMISIAGFAQSKGSWNTLCPDQQLTDDLVSPAIWGVNSPDDRFMLQRVAERTPTAEGDNVKSTVLSPPPPPPRGATVLRLFLKRNLTMDAVIELRKSLPQFDIRLGRSGLSRDNPVDVLIVDRDKVKEASVLDV